MTGNPGTLGGQIPPGDDAPARDQTEKAREAREQYALLSKQVTALAVQAKAQDTLIRDLQGRISFASIASLAESWATSQPMNYPFGPPLAFTLTEPRLVSITYQVNVQATVLSGNGVSASARISTAVRVNGADPVNGQSRGTLGAFLNLSGHSAGNEGTAAARCLVPLQAGNHTVQGVLSERTAVAAGGAAIFAIDPGLYVDVLQRI